jgi:hypothetical protein
MVKLLEENIHDIFMTLNFLNRAWKAPATKEKNYKFHSTKI